MNAMTRNDEKLLVCRVCINKVDSKDKSYNIFEKYQDLSTPGTSKDDILIADKLTACADLKIKDDDGLPNRICSRCYLELEDSYNFRRKCEKSDNILRIASRNNPDSNYEVVPVKEESGNESENSVDDKISLLQNDDIKPRHNPQSVEDIMLDNKQRINEVIPSKGEHAANNNPLVTKSKNLKLECHDCSDIFKSKTKLSDHQRTEHSNLPVTCSFCKLQFKSFQAYYKHQKNRPKTCINLSDLRIEGVGMSRHFYCKECKYNSKSVNNSLHHLVVHSKKCQYKCDQCDRSFLRVVTLRGHMERTHKHYYGEKTCHICGKVFKGFTLYDSHIRIHREKNKAHCDICNRTFSSKSSLYTHKKTHSELKPFACGKCPAKFRTSAGLYCHKKVHSQKIVACKVCGYKVKNPYIIKKHESEHDHNNAACRFCGKFFDSESQLELHMKRHDRRHACSYCDKQYNSRKILTEHLRKVHQIYVSSSDLSGKNIDKREKIKTDLVE